MKYRDAMLSAGQAYLYRLLSETGGNMAEAARVAGVHRVTMYKLLEKHGIAVEHRSYVKREDPNGKYPIKP